MRRNKVGEIETSCPVCQTEARHLRQAPGWGDWWLCANCSLEFVQPLRNTVSPVELFEAAYSGRERRNRLDDFHYRLVLRKALIGQPRLWFWTPAFAQIIASIREIVPRRGTVLELGCGAGFLLHELRNEGYDAVGLDVAESAVNLNKSDGFRVWHGTVDTVPAGWVHPDAIVMMFTLHHLDDPLGFMRAVRTNWPQTPVFLAQYGPSNWGSNWGLERTEPPRTLTHWNATSLRVLLESAGYHSSIIEVASTGVESGIFKLAHLAVDALKRLELAPWMYRVRFRIENQIVPLVATGLGRQAFVLVARASPP